MLDRIYDEEQSGVVYGCPEWIADGIVAAFPELSDEQINEVIEGFFAMMVGSAGWSYMQHRERLTRLG